MFWKNKRNFVVKKKYLERKPKMKKILNFEKPFFALIFNNFFIFCDLFRFLIAIQFQFKPDGDFDNCKTFTLHAANNLLTSTYGKSHGFLSKFNVKTVLGISNKELQHMEDSIHDYDKTNNHSACIFMMKPVYNNVGNVYSSFGDALSINNS
jgi:hypothetical protein